jgi:hypothetical protein
MEGRGSFWSENVLKKKAIMLYQLDIITGIIIIIIMEVNELIFLKSVKHFNIDPKPEGSYAMGVMIFSSIEEIIKHYQQNSLFVHEGQPVTIGKPVAFRGTPKR